MTTSHDHPHINKAAPFDHPNHHPNNDNAATLPAQWTVSHLTSPTDERLQQAASHLTSPTDTTTTDGEPPHQPNGWMTMMDGEPPHQPNRRMTTSLVQSGLLSNFDKTETWTGPHKSTNLEKLDWTDVNWFSAVFIGFLQLKDQSQPVCTGVWGVGSTLTVVPTVNKIYTKTNYITLWAPARKAPPLME